MLCPCIIKFYLQGSRRTDALGTNKEAKRLRHKTPQEKLVYSERSRRKGYLFRFLLAFLIRMQKNCK